MKFRRPKGTKDVLPKEIAKWHYVEDIIRKTTGLFNFTEIRTPTFENTELFKRGVGTDTDIVGKEMYTFEDKGGDSLTLRPEGTAPVMRAYVENGMQAEQPVHKLYYLHNMFPHEKTPSRKVQGSIHNFGAEIIRK